MVRLLGQDPKKNRRALFQHVGVQFQEGDYQKEIRVFELCEETASLYRKSADWRGLCEQFGIGDKANTAVKSLSGGERQRLFIVLALIGQPELVFLDALCDEICILKNGIPVFRGTVEEAKRQCGCEHFEDAYLRLSDGEVDA